MTTGEIGGVIEAWAEQYRSLGGLPQINHVQIFENRGAMMGCSNAHPHGQIWATQSIPNEPRKEQESLAEYRRENSNFLLCGYLQVELAAGGPGGLPKEFFFFVLPFFAPRA